MKGNRVIVLVLFYCVLFLTHGKGEVVHIPLRIAGEERPRHLRLNESDLGNLSSVYHQVIPFVRIMGYKMKNVIIWCCMYTIGATTEWLLLSLPIKMWSTFCQN